MKTLAKIAILTVLLGVIGGAVCAAEKAEGQVVSVANWVLTIKVPSGESAAFSPKWVQEGGSWQPARPARTILPALEAGETVRLTWTMDTKENRRRIETIEVTSPRQGTTRGTVVSRSASELVLRPLEKPGTVTLNMRPVQVESKWVPDPQISRIVLSLKPGDRLTVGWEWDKEGRKRIVSISNIEAAPRNPEQPREPIRK